MDKTKIVKNMFGITRPKGNAKPLDINGDGKIDFKDIGAIFTGERHYPEREQNIVQRRVREIWAKHEHRFVLLSVAIQKRERARRHWLQSRMPFGQDRKVDATINKLSEIFEDQELQLVRTDYIGIIGRIKRLEDQIADVKASLAMQSMTGNESYSRAVSKLEAKVETENAERERALARFIERLSAYGVPIAEPQAEVLLSRIDAGDVISMTAVFAVLAGITQQLADAKKSSSENVDIAKKYYAMYIGLLELQMHIQTEYVNHIDKEYIPGVVKIGDDAKSLVAETKRLAKRADKEHQDAYSRNLESLEFTVSVTELYKQALAADKDKVVKARAIIEKLHTLAENTLSTVRVSADLISLIQQAEGMFEEVMSLQTPALVPFENLQMQKEFEAVTFRLRN